MQLCAFLCGSYSTLSCVLTRNILAFYLMHI